MLSVSAPARAQLEVTDNVTFLVVLTDETQYGQCMARVKSPQLQGQCANAENWVTFGCKGDFIPKNVASRMYDTALLSMITGNKTQLVLNPDQRYNTFCQVTRIDLYDN